MVRNIVVGNSHGLAIGSWTGGGIRNVTYQDIVVNGSDGLDTGPNIVTARFRGSRDFTNFQRW